MDRILKEDIEIISKSKYVKSIEGRSVLITGATGLLGSTLALGLLKNGNIKVVALCRNKQKAKKIFNDYFNHPKLFLLIQDVTDKIGYKDNIDYIVHFASATDSKYFIEHPVETIYTAIDGTAQVLDYGKLKKVKSMVYLSSLEVYGVTNSQLGSVTEDMSGYINPLKVRSSYSESKRLVECLCASYHSEYGVPVKIARLGQTMGPGIDYHDNRVFAQFARSCIEEKDIILHTQGNTTRNYCYSRDAILAILCILLKGSSGEAYNVVNQSTTISIKNMAEMLAKKYVKTNVVLDVDNKDRGYNPDVIISLNTSKLNKLGYVANINLEEMFDRLISSMKESKKNETNK